MNTKIGTYGTKISVYAGRPLAAALLWCGPGGRSNKLAAICDRYLLVVCSEAPRWTLAQWQAVDVALADCRLSGAATDLLHPMHKLMRAAVADAVAHGLCDEWDIDSAALVEEIDEAGMAKAVAIAEVIERFRHHRQAGLSPVKAMAQVSAFTGLHILPPRPPYQCRYCGSPSWLDPADQSPPPDYCHESDHGEPPEAGEAGDQS